LQRSFTLTNNDPLPKWLVMKMVAQSLFDKGFHVDDFSFIFTPYCTTRTEHRLHFAMMPGYETVVAVASSNPGTHELFPNFPFLTQRSVFGKEGEEYRDRSWGKMLRTAVVENDRTTFAAYIASGAERILTFEEMREMYSLPRVAFVEGSVRTCLVNNHGAILVSGKILRFVSPEQTLIFLLTMHGENIEVIDQYSRDTKVCRNGEESVFHYESFFVDGEGNQDILFSLF